MGSTDAELSSVHSVLDELTERVAAAGEALLADRREAAAADLFEVERSLRAASRRLGTLRRRLG